MDQDQDGPRPQPGPGPSGSPALHLFQPHDVRSLRDRAYDDIRDAIMTGGLRPGQRIKERDVAAQMGISTTPVKEALRRLEQDGLVVSQPRRGAVVGPLVLTPAEEILQLRASLEAMAARLAAAKMTLEERQDLERRVTELEQLNALVVEDPEPVWRGTAELHRAIRRAARNEFVDRFIDTLAPFDRTVRRAQTVDPVEARLDAAEHREIVTAIIDGDGDRAERVMHRHISRVIEFLSRSGAATPRRAGRARGQRPRAIAKNR